VRQSPSPQDQVFRALADPTRRALLGRLAAGEMPVGELVAQTPMTQSAVSQHLRVLKDAGLVAERRSGRMNLYSLRPEPLRLVQDWLSHYERFWAERLDRLGAVLRSRHDDSDPI
jgi:DNA-binding transcriptional ArsR family regulator